MHAYETKTFEHNGRAYVASFFYDADMGAPWDNEDGRGDVSDWTTRDKLPGEMVLCRDHNSKRLYDFQGACAKALKEGWRASADINRTDLTPRQLAANAAMADFERLRAWCNDQWHYIGISVKSADDDSDDFGESLWGIESDAGDYLETVMRELADQIEFARAENEKMHFKPRFLACISLASQS